MSVAPSGSIAAGGAFTGAASPVQCHLLLAAEVANLLGPIARQSGLGGPFHDDLVGALGAVRRSIAGYGHGDTCVLGEGRGEASRVGDLVGRGERPGVAVAPGNGPARRDYLSRHLQRPDPHVSF